MPSNDHQAPNFERINAQIHDALAAALDDSPPPPEATTRTTSTNGTDLPGSANGPGRNQRNQRNREPAARQHPEARAKATHVEVDPDVWRFLRAQAIRWHLPLSEVVGQLVRSAVTGGVPVESAKPDVPGRRARGRRATAFTRLHGIDHETWTAFRAEAAEAGVTVARAIGILAEFAAAEVQARIPKPEPSRDHPARPRDGAVFGGRGW